jgi:hypothetical protein
MVFGMVFDIHWPMPKAETDPPFDC